jgi:16S rRNA (cytosine967-C5)-methyltransferase
LPSLASLQRAILRNVHGLLAPGGALVYSTCTLTAEENEAVVDATLAESPELLRTPPSRLPSRLASLLDGEGALRTLPHRHDMDGFFAVRFERAA